MESGIRLLKLITGETVMADIVFDDSKKIAVLKEPLIFSVLNKTDGSVSMVATKWLESLFNTHKIKTYHIVANVAPTESMEELYAESIAELKLEREYDLHGDEERSSTDEWDDLIDGLIDEDGTTIVH